MNNLDVIKLNNYFFDELEKISDMDKRTVNLYKNQYLAKIYDMEDSVYILANGVVVTSILGTDFQRVNLSYINKPGIISLLRDEDEELVSQPFDIKVDSDKAKFYKIDRLKFWAIVNDDKKLSKYVRNYYRDVINNNVQHFKNDIINNKSGQVCTFLYECTKLFGVIADRKGTVLIDHKITHQTMGEVCGINNRSSVTRIINGLVRQGVIEQNCGLLIVKNLEYLEKHSNRQSNHL